MNYKTALVEILNKLDTHTLEVVKKSSSSFLVKVLGVFAGFIVSIILGHKLGPEGLGIISLAERIVGVLLIFAMLGMNNVILKEVSIAYENQKWQHIGNIIYTALRINIPVSLILSFVLIFISPWLANHVFDEPKVEIPIVIGAIVAVPQIYSRIMAAGINGYRKIWQSQLVNNTLNIIIACLVLTVLLLLRIEITIMKVVVIYAFGRILIALILGVYWKRLFAYKGKRIMQSRPMLKIALPLLIVASAGMVSANTDTLMLGWLSDSKQIGLYSVASRLALLTSFFHFISASVLSPKIAALYYKKNVDSIEIMVQKVTTTLFAIGVFSFCLYFIFGRNILMLWGKEFVWGYWALIFLSIGQLFNLATGTTGIILMMTGHEKTLGYISFASVVLNLLLNFFLIQYYGARGAAIATAIAITLENLIKLYYVKRYTNILITPNLNKLFKFNDKKS